MTQASQEHPLRNPRAFLYQSARALCQANIERPRPRPNYHRLFIVDENNIGTAIRQDLMPIVTLQPDDILGPEAQDRAASRVETGNSRYIECAACSCESMVIV
jgi:hypothetical protein